MHMQQYSDTVIDGASLGNLLPIQLPLTSCRHVFTFTIIVDGTLAISVACGGVRGGCGGATDDRAADGAELPPVPD